MTSPAPTLPASTPAPPAPAPASGPETPIHRTHWWWIFFVAGLDYTSILGFMPSIAGNGCGRLAPVVMLVLALVTLVGAVPIYWIIAARAPHGAGAAWLLETAIPGWRGKMLLLVLLGFAASDLIFTRTFSTADAAEHLIHSPNADWQGWLGGMGRHWEDNREELPGTVTGFVKSWSSRQLVVTLLLLLVGTGVGLLFRKGITRAFVRLAVVGVGIYLLLNLLLIASGLWYLAGHSQVVEEWWRQVRAGEWGIVGQPGHAVGWPTILVAGLLLFPRVALGLAGFEMTMMLMPMIRAQKADGSDDPALRIRRARKLLLVSGFLMGTLLFGSTLLATLLIPPGSLTADGQARNRALSWLAWGQGGLPDGGSLVGSGPLFGTVYDIATVVMLTLAGVTISVAIGRALPPILAKLGMELNVSRRLNLLTYMFTGVKIAVTLFYLASVDDQISAYTVSVLGIFTFAALGVLVDAWKRRTGRRRPGRWPLPHLAFFLLFLGSTAVEILLEPTGGLIALWFILFIIATSILTRFWRSTEFRFDGFEFENEEDRLEFDALRQMDIPLLVPHRPEAMTYDEREKDIRSRHRIPAELPLVFLVVTKGDPSNFFQKPLLKVYKEEGRVVIGVSRAVSVAHVVAAVAVAFAEVGEVPEIHFGWSLENPLTANLNFVLFGSGNVPWIVHTLLRNSGLPGGRMPRVLVGG